MVGVTFLVAGGLAAGVSQVAGAEPKPTISQVQARINTLTAQFNKAVEQYDEVAQELSAAKSRLSQVNKEIVTAQAKYDAARVQVVQIADAAYEDSASTSLAGLLTSNDPTTVLSEASMVMQLTGERNLETENFLADAQELGAVQAEQERTEYGISQLAAQRAATKDSIAKLLNSEKATLATLTAQQQAAVEQNSLGGADGSASPEQYTGPTGTQADTAVAYAYAQLGCPYVYGGTGPCDLGFDCSGLVMQAWAAAGVTIPRDTYEQWAALPHISLSSIEPGDLLYYNGIGHVAMYVGDGYIIDSPQPGMDVEKIPMDTPWYADNFDGAARP
ncbi:C40 family peptidase [Trebonia sp.]|uniref:C40 family peptidase n=1 Tax=Trebonia sp. TaxID=2767075 RepID=UPI00262F618B|nr:C40 family peptidase [Trebonia sp.]